MKQIFLYALLALCIVGSAQAAYVTDANGQTLSTNGANTIFIGAKFVANANTPLVNVTRYAGDLTTRARLYNETGCVLLEERTTLTGNVYTGWTTTLTRGQTYTIVFDGNGGSVNRQYRDPGVSYPIAGTNINWTAGASGTACTTEAAGLYTVTSITTGSAFTFTAINNLTSASITGFSVNVTYANGTTVTLSTTGTSIATSIPAGIHINATFFNASGYLEANYTNYNTTPNLVGSLVPSFKITAYDIYDNTTLTSFSALVEHDGITSNFTTTTGQINTTVGQNNKTVNVTIQATNYFNHYQSNHNTTSNLNKSAWQVEVRFNSTEIVTGTAVTGFTVTTTNATNNSATPILFLKAGTYNITWSKTSWFSNSGVFTYAALTNTTSNFTDVYQFRINVTARTAIANSSITSFTAYINSTTATYNRSGSTTTTDFIVPWFNDTNVNVTINTTGYAISSTRANVTQSGTTNVTLYLYTSESINIKFFDETNNMLLNGVNITFFLTSTVAGYNYSTSNGTHYIDLISPATYTITYNASGYGTREYIYTITNQSTSTLYLYLLNSTIDDLVQVTISDTGAKRVESAIVKMQKKNLSGTDYYIVEMCSTNKLGQCILHVNLYDTVYRFIVEYDGETLFNSNDTRVDRTTIAATIARETTLLTRFYELNSVEYNLTNGTNNFTFVWNDVYNNAQNGCLQIVRRDGASLTILSDNCTTTASGTLTYIFNNATGDEWIAVAYITVEDGTEYILDTASIVVSEFKRQFGQEGLFLFGFLVLGVMAFGGMFIHPTIPLVVIGIGSFIMNGIGLLSIGTSAVMSLICVLAIIIILMRKA